MFDLLLVAIGAGISAVLSSGDSQGSKEEDKPEEEEKFDVQNFSCHIEPAGQAGYRFSSEGFKPNLLSESYQPPVFQFEAPAVKLPEIPTIEFPEVKLERFTCNFSRPEPNRTVLSNFEIKLPEIQPIKIPDISISIPSWSSVDEDEPGSSLVDRTLNRTEYGLNRSPDADPTYWTTNPYLRGLSDDGQAPDKGMPYGFNEYQTNLTYHLNNMVEPTYWLQNPYAGGEDSGVDI